MLATSLNKKNRLVVQVWDYVLHCKCLALEKPLCIYSVTVWGDRDVSLDAKYSWGKYEPWGVVRSRRSAYRSTCRIIYNKSITKSSDLKKETVFDVHRSDSHWNATREFVKSLCQQQQEIARHKIIQKP